MSQTGCSKAVRTRSRAIDDLLHCERCGWSTGIADYKGELSRHHRLKRSHLPKDRLWEAHNVVLLCGDGTRGCHGWVEANPDAAREEGFHVRSYEDPRQVPVRLWHTDSPVYLDDLGGWWVDPPGKQVDDG